MASPISVGRRVRLWGVWALVAGGLAGPPAHADLYGALKAFKQHDYSAAFQEFHALAKLGQPFSQLDVAYLYVTGEGTTVSAARADAWAQLAAENGQAAAKKLLGQLQPLLSPADRRAAARIVARYSPATLRRRLLPVAVGSCGGSHPSQRAASCPFVIHANPACNAVNYDRYAYPAMEGIFENMQSQVVVQFTLMPDGTARLPHVVFGLPEPGFRSAVRTSILRSKFRRLPPGVQSVQCDLDVSFVERDIEDLSAYRRLDRNLLRMRLAARQGNPSAEATYGTLLAGLPQVGRWRGRNFLKWLVKAAQAGVRYAQYEVGESLMAGWGCRPDPAKSLRWLRLAAAQHEPHAEAALAARLLRGEPRAAAMEKARRWLAGAAASHDKAAAVYLSALLAAAPQSGLRDPARALRLEREAFEHVGVDPTGYEIRAAAYAAEGHFKRAVRLERRAIAHARALGWSLAPLQARLRRYRAGKPWFGNLLNFGVPASELPLPPCREGKCLSRVPDGEMGQRREAALVGRIGEGLQRFQRLVGRVLGQTGRVVEPAGRLDRLDDGIELRAALLDRLADDRPLRLGAPA